MKHGRAAQISILSRLLDIVSLAWLTVAYAEPVSIAVTLGSVRRALADEEATALKEGTFIALHDQVSPSVLILAGLEMEELQ